jgi:hypothetical protein
LEFGGRENAHFRYPPSVPAWDGQNASPALSASEAVHTGIAEAGLGRPAVPKLPDAGGAVFDEESPRREGVVVDEPVGHVARPEAVSGLRTIFASASIKIVNS